MESVTSLPINNTRHRARERESPNKNWLSYYITNICLLFY